MSGTATTELQGKLAIATEALRRADERATAGQLALEIIHEIQNPLQALEHINYLALSVADDPAQVRKFLQMAEEQLTTLGHITSQTLGFARTCASPRPAVLAELAEAALRIHQRSIEAKKVRLVKDLPAEVMAEVYTGEMLQVISNLIMNALDALQPGGTLCLRLRKRQDKIHLVIADNGHGIPRESIDKVFRPFFTTKQESGTGLGLALSKKIIERHNGNVRLRSSVSPGKSGTIFKISIPA